MNLLAETLRCLADNNRTNKDILFISLDNTWHNFKEFVGVADREMKPTEINKSLQIIGNDFIMEWTCNGEDGEWWFIEVLPERPPFYKKPVSLIT